MIDTPSQKQNGLTLIEVVIAVGIMSVILLATYQFLTNSLNSSEILDKRSAELNTLQRSMRLIARDFEQLANRSIRDRYGDRLKPFETDTEDYLVEFTRQGWRNPLNRNRSELQRVAYKFESGELRRYYWFVLDRAQDSEPNMQVMLSDVDDFNIRFLDAYQKWHNEWPINFQSPKDRRAFPVAIELVIKHKRFGEIRRVFQLLDA